MATLVRSETLRRTTFSGDKKRMREDPLNAVEEFPDLESSSVNENIPDLHAKAHILVLHPSFVGDRCC